MKVIFKLFCLISVYVFAFAPQLFAEPLKVGIALPLSGAIAEFGNAVKNGIALAQADQGAEAAKAIEFIYEDSRYDAKLAISAFNKLTKAEGIDLFYVWGTTPSIAIAALVDTNRVPTLALSGEPYVAGGRKYLIDTTNRLEEFSVATLRALRKKGLKKYAVVKMETQYLTSLIEGIKLNLADDESLTEIASYAPDSTPDFNTVIAKIKAGIIQGKFDSIGVFLGTGQVSSFYQKMDQFKLNVATFGSDYLGQEDEMKRAGSASIGAFFSTPHVASEFEQRYINQFKSRVALNFAANSYDLATLLFGLFKEQKQKRDADQIISALRGAAPIVGASGKYEFIDESGTSLKLPGARFISPIAIREVRPDGGTSLFIPQ